MELIDLEMQIKSLIKSNLISSGLSSEQIDKIVENLYQDLENVLGVK